MTTRRRRVHAGPRRAAVVLAAWLLVLAAACAGGGDGGGPSAEDGPNEGHGHGHHHDHDHHGGSGPTGTFVDDRPAAGGHLRLGVAAPVDLAGFVPWLVAPDDHAGLVLADLLFESLLTLPAVGLDGSAAGAGPEPALATSVEPDTDLMTWTVVLGAASFSDGSPVTARDVAATLTAAAALGADVALGHALGVIVGADDLAAGATTDLAGVEVVSDRTLVISLVEPYAPFPELLASPLLGIAPETAAAPGTGAWVGPRCRTQPGC